MHPVTGQKNANVALHYAAFDPEKTCFVFVSHRWLRAMMGDGGHPDDAEGVKRELVIMVLEKLRGPRAEVPEDMEFALWVDNGCIDQDAADPGGELKEQMRMSWPIAT